MQGAIKDLQDAMVVMAHLEKRQTEILKAHADLLNSHVDLLNSHDEHLGEIEEFHRRTDQNLAEITDKLNGLIGYVAGQGPTGAPPQ